MARAARASRLADLAVHDAYYARAIGRIRAFYLTLDPTGAQYWMQPAGDDPHAVMRQAGQQHTRWHHFSHTATSVAAVTAVIAGALVGLVLTRTVSIPVPLVATIAAVAGSALFALTWLDQERRWSRSDMAEATRFLPDGAPAPARVPTPPAVPARDAETRPVPAVA